MARAYTLNIAADTRAVKVGIDKGVIEPLEDALEVLEDIGRDGGRDLDKLEDAARDAQDQTEKVKREFSDLAKEIRETGRKAKTDFGDKIKDSSGEAKEAVDEIGREAESTGKEMAASFDGSIESIADAFQELTANAFAGFGPAGAAAGIAAALGLGVVLQAFTAQQEAADELKERITSAYRTAIEEGNSYLSEAQIIEAALDILQSDRRGKLEEDAKTLGVAFNTVLRAEAGDYEALKEAIAAAEQAQSERFEAGSQEAGARAMQIDTEIGKIEGIIRSLEDQKKTHDDSRAAAAAYSEFVSESERRQREQIDKTRAADQARYEAAARQYGVKLPSPVIPIEVSTPNIDSIVARLQRDANNKRIRIPGSVFTRNGVEVF